LCIGLGVFEGYTSVNFGDPDHQVKFDTLISLFPSTYTIRDIFGLVRVMFPLLVQFVVLALDYTLDAVDTSDRQEQPVNITELYDDILMKQGRILERLDAFSKLSAPKQRDRAEFKAIYDEIIAFHSEDSYRLQPELDKEAEAEKNKDSTCTKIVKYGFGILTMVSLFSAFIKLA
jgi:hypothetical protein